MNPTAITIRPPGRWCMPDVAELWHFRELSRALMVRGIGKACVLGRSARVESLLEVGTGFQPELTGRDVERVELPPRLVVLPHESRVLPREAQRIVDEAVRLECREAPAAGQP